MCMRQLHDEFRVQPMPNARDQRLKQRHCRMLDLARNLVQSEPDAWFFDLARNLVQSEPDAWFLI